MISGIDLNATTDYTCQNDKDNPTIWKLGVLPNSVLSQMPEITDVNEKATMVFKLLQVGLKGWSNYKIGGKDVEYKTEKTRLFGQSIEAVPEDIIQTIPFMVCMELATKLLEVNKVTDKEQKNS